jgi:pilus assembly protein CpaB
MNFMRFAILGVAFIAAAAAVLLARGMLGGGTTVTQAAPPLVQTIDILVASKDIQPGHLLSADAVRWEPWPKKSVPPAGFITKEAQPDIAKAIEGSVARAPFISGQPITETSIVRAGATGFLAATIKPGMRAVSLLVSAETSAGGFILPNDRVDVLFSRDVSGGSGSKNFASAIILRDIRVLAVDQTAQPQKDQQSVVGKTVTLELLPDQAELLARSQQMGIVSLALRALGDNGADTVAAEPAPAKRPPVVVFAPRVAKPETVVVFRYGVRRDGDAGARGAGSANPGPAAPSASADTSGIANPVSVNVAPAPVAALTPQ